MAEREEEEEAPAGRRLAEQGNTDAKLFVPDDNQDQDVPQEDGLEDAEASGEGEPEGTEEA